MCVTILIVFQGCTQRKTELEEVVKGLTTEVAKEEVTLKKTGRSVEVLTLQQSALEERVRELEREGREAGSTMDASHLKKLEMQVKAFEKGDGGEEGGWREEGGRRREGELLMILIFTDHAKAADRAGEVESEVKRYGMWTHT